MLADFGASLIGTWGGVPGQIFGHAYVTVKDVVGGVAGGKSATEIGIRVTADNLLTAAGNRLPGAPGPSNAPISQLIRNTPVKVWRNAVGTWAGGQDLGLAMDGASH
jgi:hypothetical protein